MHLALAWSNAAAAAPLVLRAWAPRGGGETQDPAAACTHLSPHPVLGDVVHHSSMR